MRVCKNTHFMRERQWLDGFRVAQSLLDVAIRAAEREQDRATRITSVLDGIGGGRGSGVSDKVGTGVVNYDALLPYLRERVKVYATQIAERFEAIDAVTLPEARDALWRQYIEGISVREMAVEFGVHRKTVHAWILIGLAQIHERLEKQNPGA